MSSKKIVILILSLVAVAAVTVSLCLIFLTNQMIKAVPESVSVQKLGDDIVLTTDFSEKYYYNFKIEQKFGEEFVELDVVKSDKNYISLTEQSIDLVAGNQFRFSAGFATESGSGDGKFCEAIVWTPSETLAEVNYQSLEIELQSGTITWEAVEKADFYSLNFVDQNGGQKLFVCDENAFSWLENGKSALKAGEYQLFIVAQSEKESVLSSNAGEGFGTIKISLQNEILDISHSQEKLLVTCTQQTRVFQVFAGDQVFCIEANAETVDGDRFVYDLSEFLPFFNALKDQNETVKMKTLGNGLVLESELFLLK